MNHPSCRTQPRPQQPAETRPQGPIPTRGSRSHWACSWSWVCVGNINTYIICPARTVVTKDGVPESRWVYAANRFARNVSSAFPPVPTSEFLMRLHLLQKTKPRRNDRCLARGSTAGYRGVVCGSREFGALCAAASYKTRTHGCGSVRDLPRCGHLGECVRPIQVLREARR